MEQQTNYGVAGCRIPFSASNNPMGNLSIAYHTRLTAGDLQADDAQEQALTAFDALVDRLKGYTPQRFGFVKRLFAGPTPPLGLYLYGDVGRGKSMLMDLFFEVVLIEKKRRVHFHQFMLEIHQRLFDLQAEDKTNLLQEVARSLVKDTWLLCFDEFHVDNIVDAMILGRLFEALFEVGIVVVSTSNWAPEDLYKNGLQRERFLPFIDLISKHMQIYKLAGPVDHRLEKTQNLATIFFPLNSQSTQKLRTIFFQLNGNAEPEEMILQVQGRSLTLLHTSKGVGFFNFDELCVQPLGSADYLALSLCFHTLLIDEVPQMTAERRNETVRFINLIDALYEAKVKLFLCCAVPLEFLGPKGELGMPFQRTQSRLTEMQSAEYKALPHRLG